MSAIYTIFTSPDHPPVPDHLPTLIVTPAGKPAQVLYTYLHTNYNRENYLLTPSPQGDLCVAKLFPPPINGTSASSRSINGKASSEGHGSSSSGSSSSNTRTVKCEASRNFKWSITNSGVLTPTYKCTLPSEDGPGGIADEQPLFQISKTNPSSPFWTCWYYAYAGHLIPPKRIQFGHISKNIGPDGKPITGGGTRVTITGKSDEEKAVWKTLGEGNEDMVEWAVICAALHVLDDEIVKAAEAAGIRIGVMPGARMGPPNRNTPPPNAMPRPQLHPTGLRNAPVNAQPPSRPSLLQSAPPAPLPVPQQGPDPRNLRQPPLSAPPSQGPPPPRPQQSGQVFPPPRQPQSLPPGPLPQQVPHVPSQGPLRDVRPHQMQMIPPQQQNMMSPPAPQPPALSQVQQKLMARSAHRPGPPPPPATGPSQSPNGFNQTGPVNGQRGPLPMPLQATPPNGPARPLLPQQQLPGPSSGGPPKESYGTPLPNPGPPPPMPAPHGLGQRPPPNAQQNHYVPPQFVNSQSHAPTGAHPPPPRMPAPLQHGAGGQHPPPPRSAPPVSISALRSRSPMPAPGSSNITSPQYVTSPTTTSASAPNQPLPGYPGRRPSEPLQNTNGLRNNSLPNGVSSGRAGSAPAPELKEEDTVDSVAFMLGTTALNDTVSDRPEASSRSNDGAGLSKLSKLLKHRS